MPRRVLLSLLLFCGFASVCRAGDSVILKIRQLGLEGIYSPNGTASWVEIEARNATHNALSLNLLVSQLNFENDARPAAETIRIPVTLAAAETRTVNVPLHIYQLNHAAVFAEARDAQGNTLGRAGRRVEQMIQGRVIAILCSGSQVCQSIRQSILLSGSAEEQTRKSQFLRIVQLSEVPPVPWAYTPVGTLILATSVAGLSKEQLEALEVYALRGGTLALVEDQLADGPILLPASASGHSSDASTSLASNGRFLEPYRALASEGKLYPIGWGKLVHFKSVSAKEFTDYFRPLGFSESTPREIVEQWQLRARALAALGGTQGDDAAWLMSRLGTSFRFPTFLQLLLWIVGYLLLVGVVNFIFLRRIGRPEWGWVTIPAISILFSVLLYVVSAWNHPRNFGLDEIVEYRLDPLSPLALQQAKVRVSAPERANVHPVLPAGVVFEYPQGTFFSDVVTFAMQRSGDFFSQIELGETWQSQFPLRRWSFRDLDFSGHRRFAGTIYRDSLGRFHNESGINFQQAIVVDHEDVFVLGNYSAGAVVDLGHVKRLSYPQETGRVVRANQGYPGPPFPFKETEGGGHWRASVEEYRRDEQERNALARQPFSLLELIRGWSSKGDDVFYETKAVFFGLSTEATLGATLRDRSPDHQAFSLTIVTFKEWP